MFSTPPGWMSAVRGTRVPCPSRSPAAPCRARAQALAPVTDQAPAPVHVRALTHVKHLTPTPTYVKPIVPARDQATSPASVKAPDHVMARAPGHAQAPDPARAPTKGPPSLHCLTVSSLKGHHSRLSLMLLTPLPQAFLLSQTSSAQCLCIPPACCWCATAAWPISSWWRPSRRCENGLCAGKTNPWRPACIAWSASARQRRISARARRKRRGK